MENIQVLYEEEEITIEKRVVQDLFIQWNKNMKPDWAKMISVGLKFIVEKYNPKEPLIIRRNEDAWNYIVSCQEWA
jgi:hypothetical protein